MLGGTVWTYSREQKKKLSQSRSGIHFFALFCIEGITFNCAIGACARAKRPGIFREGGGLLRLIRNHSKVSFENLGTVFFFVPAKTTSFSLAHIGFANMTSAALWSFPKSARWEETLVLLCFAQPTV